jgi:hypothetical protein
VIGGWSILYFPVAATSRYCNCLCQTMASSSIMSMDVIKLFFTVIVGYSFSILATSVTCLQQA